MSDRSRIEWTDATWNIVLGCDRVSAGCSGCYAISNARIRESHPDPKIAVPYAGLVERRDGRMDWTGQVNLVPDRLHLPLSWKKPRKIFVTAQSDLFHPAVPDEFLVQVFAVMAVAQRHVFQVLTKRPGRMRALLGRPEFTEQVGRAATELDRSWTAAAGWPLPNVWLGVSAEDNRWASIRVPGLLQTPAAVRFVSAEPLLSAITLCCCDGTATLLSQHGCPLHGSVRLDWVIVGGESGPNARPMHPDWARQLRDQCHAAGVAFLFKQWGEWGPSTGEPGDRWVPPEPDGDPLLAQPADPAKRLAQEVMNRLSGVPLLVPVADAPMRRVGKRQAGRRLDGRSWDEYPKPVTTLDRTLAR